MRRIIPIFFILNLFSAAGFARDHSLLPQNHFGQKPFLSSQQGLLSDSEIRGRRVEELDRQKRSQKEEAWSIALAQGWAPRRIIEGRVFDLMAIEGGRVYIYKTCNSNAAVSIAVDLIRNTPPYNLNGTGLTMGIWDGGAVRSTHQEFVSRISILDGAAVIDHATHVGGTLAAAGIVLSAMGMAPSVHLDSYEWTSDIAEMTSRAMSYPNEPGTLQVSNHSYGYACGWENDYSPPRWYGTWSRGVRESDYFGQYDSGAAKWDQLCYDAPYYLPFKAAGNDRNDNAPQDGETFQYYKYPLWKPATYNSSIHPYSDYWDNGGYDTILPISNAKNIVTVGAVNDAVTSGLRDTSKASMTSFSGWGPTDDGRIKPDVVTNGVSVYSSTAVNNSSYAAYSGTSVAAPGAAGAAVLLTEYYGQLFPGQVMRAGTIKALLIHTADDLGNPGPDYKFGWGLVNAKAAADKIRDHFDFPEVGKIAEGLLNGSNPIDSYIFKWDGMHEIRATLCWTDPPATALTGLDNPLLRLKNDLDLRIIDPNGAVFMPFVLNPANPSAAASTGDNVRDNVEQVLIASPAIPGNYTLQVSHKGMLTNGQQYYSLILSGQALPQPLVGDFTGDGVVDCNDLYVFSGYWLQFEPSVDLDPSEPNGVINYRDFSVFSEKWMKNSE